MTDKPAELDRVVERMREPLTAYAEYVRGLWGSSLKSLSVYGAITESSFDTTRQVARSVAVLDAVELSVLRRLARDGVRFGKQSIAAPLVMTPAYIAESLDTFPLEFIEIMQAHLTLIGDDPFERLDIKNTHVRLQCERELKTVLIGLRQGLLAAAGQEKRLAAIEMDAAEGLMRTLRGILWLKGQREVVAAQHVFAAVEEISGSKLRGVRAALDATSSHGWAEFENLYTDVAGLAKVVDGL